MYSVSDEISRYPPNRALDIDGLAEPEEVLGVIDNFNATVIRLWFPLKLLVHALKHCRASDIGTTVRGMLTTIIGEHLALQCDWLGVAENPLFPSIDVYEP